MGSVALRRIPKKLHCEISCGNDPNNHPVGWGIYIVEGFNWAVIRHYTLVALLVLSLLTIFWSILQQDVSGGMGIGQFSVAVVAVFLSVILIGHGGDRSDHF